MAASNDYRLPPGPKRNLVWHLFRDFHPEHTLKLFTYLAATYGDIAYYRFGPYKIVFLNHPEYVHRVLVTDSSSFIKERILQIVRDLVMGEGLLTSEGEHHKCQRRAAQPAFLRQKMPDYTSTMVRHAADLREHWSAGGRWNISVEMARLMLSIAADALFQTDLGEEAHEMSAAVSDLVELPEYVAVFPFLIRVPLPKHRRFFAARRRMDELIFRMIEKHDQTCPGGEDLLCLMRRGCQNRNGKSIRAQLRDSISTLILAGHETTATGLTWAWYLLSQNPEVEARLHAEVDSVLGGSLPTAESLPRLPYTGMVLAESLRLFPPVWGIGRTAVKDFELGPYRLPAGTIVLMSPYVMHRDPRFYDEPLEFRPERSSSGSRNGQQKFSFFPFGGGIRACIGEAFALSEAILGIAAIAQKWRLRLAPGQLIEPYPYITLRPKYGMWMNVEPR